MKRVLFVLLMLALLGTAGVHAQSGGPYELAWGSIDAGGGAATGGAYTLATAIGQPEAGATQSGGGYSLNGGVVDAGNSGGTPPGNLRIYLPLIVR
jgi:hypothetical protein